MFGSGVRTRSDYLQSARFHSYRIVSRRVAAGHVTSNQSPALPIVKHGRRNPSNLLGSNPVESYIITSSRIKSCHIKSESSAAHGQTWVAQSISSNHVISRRFGSYQIPSILIMSHQFVSIHVGSDQIRVQRCPWSNMGGAIYQIGSSRI